MSDSTPSVVPEYQSPVTSDPAKPQESGTQEVPTTLLHERAKAAATEAQKLIVSLATGTVAAFFIGLTGGEHVQLRRSEKWALLLALTFMGSAVVAGLITWLADAKRYYYWAASKQARGKRRKELKAQQASWIRIWRYSGNTLGILFALGIVGAVVYLYLRVLS